MMARIYACRAANKLTSACSGILRETLSNVRSRTERRVVLLLQVKNLNYCFCIILSCICVNVINNARYLIGYIKKK
jgi:hypothetical protein